MQWYVCWLWVIWNDGCRNSCNVMIVLVIHVCIIASASMYFCCHQLTLLMFSSLILMNGLMNSICSFSLWVIVLDIETAGCLQHDTKIVECDLFLVLIVFDKFNLIVQSYVEHYIQMLYCLKHTLKISFLTASYISNMICQ